MAFNCRTDCELQSVATPTQNRNANIWFNFTDPIETCVKPKADAFIASVQDTNLNLNVSVSKKRKNADLLNCKDALCVDRGVVFFNASVPTDDTRIPVESITVLDKDGNTLPPDSATAVSTNETYQLGLTFAPANTTQTDVVWYSSDDSIATVDNKGLVKFLNKEGGVTISVKSTKDSAIQSSAIFDVRRAG